jgi:nucleoside-diphosphate-sugar epimerase
MKRLLVTGSSGLIGSEIVSHFAPAGWWVTGLFVIGRGCSDSWRT